MIEFKESKFYKLLQDFFINNNKETFLQMLGEFYNRTEGIINKNEIQDDLIKELRDLYLEFNEKGIDENIVIEKVNYFVENNVKIKDILAKLVINTNKIESNTEKLNTNTSNIENITSQLDTKVNKADQESEMISRRVRGENSINSPAGSFDSANFAGQTLGKKAPIGNVFHHYTDGKCIQIDNVGEGNVILTMVNANNPVRRADKPNTFFGTGYYLQLMTNNPNTEEVYSHFVIDENGNPFWNGVKPSGTKNNTTTFKNAKDDLSLPCFEFVPINKHQRPYSYKNGNGRVLYYVEENGTVCSITSPLEYIELKGTNARIVGTEITLVGKSKSKGINGDLRELQLREVGARSGYNTDNIKVGTMIFDNTLNKPLWWDGSNWRDANGTIV